MEWKPAGEIALICFTRRGAALCRQIGKGLSDDGIPWKGYRKGRSLERMAAIETEGLVIVAEPLSQWTGKQFLKAAGLVFIGAVGIAVRAAAPWIQDKFCDPALVAVDETGAFTIPLLSGHAGGANDLAKRISRYTGGVPVITTATDVQGRFAIDVFARDQKLWISDRKLAKAISAAVLAGESIGLFSDFSVIGAIPEGFLLDRRCRLNVFITVYHKAGYESVDPDKITDVPGKEDSGNLLLVPKILTLGIGCRKGIGREALKSQVMAGLSQNHILPQAVRRVATLDRKKEEDALRWLCEVMSWELVCFSADELNEQEGDFIHSDFVEKTVGVDNVCERAALRACQFPEIGKEGEGAECVFVKENKKGRLIVKKQRLNKTALAVAAPWWQVILPCEPQ